MDWQTTISNNVTSPLELKVLLNLSPGEYDRIREESELFPMSVTRYYLSLIDPEDPGHIYDPSARSAVNGAYLLTLIFPAVTLVGGICAGIILCIVRKVLQKPQKDERGGIQ